jgi:hypothetical protein
MLVDTNNLIFGTGCAMPTDTNNVSGIRGVTRRCKILTCGEILVCTVRLPDFSPPPSTPPPPSVPSSPPSTPTPQEPRCRQRRAPLPPEPHPSTLAPSPAATGEPPKSASAKPRLSAPAPSPSTVGSPPRSAEAKLHYRKSLTQKHHRRRPAATSTIGGPL